MELWTWQGPCFDLHQGILDPRKSEYANGSVPEYLSAVREIEVKLGTNQFIWASRDRNPDKGRIGYRLEVQEAHILAVLDGFLWNRRLGQQICPPKASTDAWEKEAANLYPYDGKLRSDYVDTKTKEWQRIPLPADWWQRAKDIGAHSEIPQYLLRYPIARERVKETDTSQLRGIE